MARLDPQRRDSLARHVSACSEPSVRHLDGDLTIDHGFMPRVLADCLLPKRYDAWEQVVARLPDLAFASNAQAILGDLPLLAVDADHLPDDQLKRAATMLGIIAHCYWRFGIARMYHARNSDVPDQLPEVIERPWRQVCQRLGRASEGFTTEDCFFNNFTFLDKNQIGPGGLYRIEEAKIEALRPMIRVYGNEAERVFVSAFVEVNAAVTPAIRLACQLEQAIGDGGPDAHEMVSGLLVNLAKCARGAMSSFRRISPRKNSSTFCDPVDWAKTYVTWTVPAAGYPTGPSGSATPLVHFFDALLCRAQYETTLGAFAKGLRRTQLPKKHREFFDLVRALDIRGYVQSLAGVASARYRATAEAFNELVESFAGDSGFLGVHKGKVVDYLGVGTIVGRNQSTAHDQTYVANATWTEMAGKLEDAREERTTLELATPGPLDRPQPPNASTAKSVADDTCSSISVPRPSTPAALRDYVG
ncbi:hypothetical protein [Amycolatopsis speibonae]|uniref:Indoleamine 2,3-dioxygenase n=1 Tax=Amycolatopsis speibonae TaxID=1450224 RepID=A0ABV7PCW8_9PSEU